MNTVLKIILLLCLLLSIAEIILAYVYDKEFSYLDEKRNSKDKFDTLTNKMEKIKTIMGNAINILAIIIFIYDFIYNAIIYFSETEFYDKYLYAHNTSVQSDSKYSSIFIEMFFTLITKILALSLSIFFISLSLNEINEVKENPQFLVLET